MVTTLAKVCARCKTTKPLSEFYIRAPFQNQDNPPTLPGHYISECKLCMQERSKQSNRLPASEPRAKTEVLAIEYLRQNGIHALPGKAVSAADVDVVAWGGIWIEVKYSRLDRGYAEREFVFSATPAQRRRGFLAHIVMLVCDYGHEITYHLFDTTDPVFYMHGRVKSGLTFRPGRMKAAKHANNRVVMTQPMMDSARDNVQLIWDWLMKLSQQLRDNQ